MTILGIYLLLAGMALAIIGIVCAVFWVTQAPVMELHCPHCGVVDRHDDKGNCEKCGLGVENAELRRQVATVGAERDRIANQYDELAELFRGPIGTDHDAAVSNAACAVNELYEMTEERNGIRQERDLLRRQVDALLSAWKHSASCSACVLVRKQSGKAAAANYCQFTADCADTMREWSLAKAKEGGGG